MKKTFEESVAEARAEVFAVSPQEANRRKTFEPLTLFIDPRPAADIGTTTGIIPGALNLPLDELNNRTDEDLPQELASRSRPIITACQGGPMGALAACALKRRGYHNVFYMDGGTQGWLDAGFTTSG